MLQLIVYHVDKSNVISSYSFYMAVRPDVSIREVCLIAYKLSFNKELYLLYPNHIYWACLRLEIKSD